MNAHESRKGRVVYLGLGSNINPEKNLARAVALLRKQVRLLALSTAWETPPDGSNGPDFLNAAALIQTQLAAGDLRAQILRPIESRLGRVRTADPNAPRTIDLDILVYDGEVAEPEIWERIYLALPLSELLPGLLHPESGESLRQVADRLIQGVPISPRPDVFLHLPLAWGEDHSTDRQPGPDSL